MVKLCERRLQRKTNRAALCVHNFDDEANAITVSVKLKLTICEYDGVNLNFEQCRLQAKRLC
uniref:Uncharacterized protein n=1 Tax=Helianthus annuus TaxID=4232 RepID=A0A251SEQ9_HELAN